MKEYITPTLEYIQLQAEESIATSGSKCKHSSVDAETASADLSFFW